MVIIPLSTATTTAALRRTTHRVFGGGRPSLSSVSIRETLNGVFMERCGDGDGPALLVRDAPVADRVEKSVAYQAGSLFSSASPWRISMVNINRNSTRIVKVSIYQL